MEDRVVITGIGMITSVGDDRESTWQAVRAGRSGVRLLEGVPAIPDGLLLGATVKKSFAEDSRVRHLPLALQAAEEALRDSQIALPWVDKSRFGCAIAANVGDTPGLSALRNENRPALATQPWWKQWLPNTTCATVAQQFDLQGPRLSNSTACASGSIATLTAVRAIRDNQCDMALAGASQTINPILAAGFRSMRVLATHEQPQLACRPFDANRSGFVMGEGAAMLVLERLDHALARRAPIYAEVAGGHLACDAHHVTDLSVDSTTLTRLIRQTLRSAGLAAVDIAYINAHGTGTQQNDVMETHAIHEAFGRAADTVCLSSTKSVLGHLLNAAGAVELAITALALRDGFAPPTINLTDPDPECDLDCVPLVGRRAELEHALKLSIAFGGHLAAVALRRWNDAGERASILTLRRAA